MNEKCTKIVLAAVLLVSMAMVIPKIVLLRNGAVGESSGATYPEIERVIANLEESGKLNMGKEEIEDLVVAALLEQSDDKYATFFEHDEFQGFLAGVGTEYEGIGVACVINEDGLPMVVDVLKSSPAAKAGLESGDVILLVDGEDASTMSQSEVEKAIRGNRGVSVCLEVKRQNDSSRKLYITRNEIAIAPDVVSTLLNDGPGYIRIRLFNPGVEARFKKQCYSLVAQGAQGIVIDLRGNPGGSVEEVVKIADDLLGVQSILNIDMTNGEDIEYSSDEFMIPVEIAVLIDQNSASAAEILAMAIQSYGRGEVVGVTSYGKGTVQEVYTNPDGTGYKMTVGEYYGPQWEKVDRRGVVPNYYIEYSGGYDNQLEKAVSILLEKK